MHITITKCLDYWFSVDVAASMLVDKRKSVPLRFGENVFANFAKKENKNKQPKKHCNVVSRCVNQQPATRRLVISQPPSGQSLFLKESCPIILSSLWTKSCGATIHLKHLWLNCHMVLFI